MKLLTLSMLVLCFHTAHSFSIFDHQEELIEECEELIEQIEKSNCGRHTLAILKDAYLKIGLDFSQRNILFENKEKAQPAFNMIGKWTPSPLLTFSFGDSFFGDSDWGYQLGLAYISDTAYEQKMERSREKTRSADLLTYTKITVFAFTPSVFYRFGHNDDTPHTSFTIGLGLNAGFSFIKGTAYLTEDKSNTGCYDAGTNYVNGTGPASEISTHCEFTAYESDDLTTGANLYLEYEYRQWLLTFRSGVYTQELRGDYTFATYDNTFSIARKFGF